ncbi:MAG: glycosyltransferase family A protein [Bacteroidota bacterium]|nr:glycosyltransferase family A protein [Bacteroidota bacterium]
MKPKVTIIIPCFNAGLYIEETLSSVLRQRGAEIEVKIIDDGSTDNTAERIQSFKDPRISYMFQENCGVSASRNRGLEVATGEFVIFFDADDIMPENFISTRSVKLELNAAIDFVCGTVRKFDAAGISPELFQGPASDELVDQILLYHPKVITCPSNFMFRNSFLKKHSLKFEERLSSTADRYFILLCNRYGRLAFYPDVVPLHYRVNNKSMSNLLNLSLVRDNEEYYNLLKNTSLIPQRIRNISLFLGNYILFGANWKIGKKVRAIRFAISSFFRNPLKFISKVSNLY